MNFWGFVSIPQYIPLKIGSKVKKLRTLNSVYWIYNHFFFVVVFSGNAYFQNVVWTLSNVVQCCSYQQWNRQRWFDVVRRCEFQRWETQRCFNVDLTLPHVATWYQPKYNIEIAFKCLLGTNLNAKH